MWQKPYGRTGKNVSVIGFGGMRFAKPQDQELSAGVVVHAYNKGVNYFDTAPYYCEDKSEEIFGRAFKAMKPGTFHCSTKCMESDGAELRKSLEQSLRRLGVPQITFFHIWCVNSLESWKERQSGGAVAAAIKAKQEGLVEHVVVSSHLPGGQLAQVLKEGPFEGVTLGYCAINFPYRQEAVDLAGASGLGVVTMNPLAGGLIAQNPDSFDFLRGPRDRSAVEAALRFNVSQPAISVALVGFADTAQVDQAVAAVEDFQPYEKAHIDAVRKKVLGSYNSLCTGCGYCLPCPEGIQVPQLMDAYNHKILSKKPGEQAVIDRLRWHWGCTPEAAKACALCGQCEERCTQHLPIRDRMKEIAAIKVEKK